MSSPIREVKILTIREGPQLTPEPMTDPQMVADFWRTEIVSAAWYDSEKEAGIVLCLDTKLHLKSYTLVGLGTVSGLDTMPREVFRPAIIAAAKAIIFVHNHPAGDPTLSREDKLTAQRLKDAGELLGVPLLDFIAVGETEHASANASVWL